MKNNLLKQNIFVRLFKKLSFVQPALPQFDDVERQKSPSRKGTLPQVEMLERQSKSSFVTEKTPKNVYDWSYLFHLDALPHDLILKIYAYLDNSDLLNALQINKRFNAILATEAQHRHNHLLARHFPHLIITEIFSYLNYNDLVSGLRVNHHFHDSLLTNTVCQPTIKYFGYKRHPQLTNRPHYFKGTLKSSYMDMRSLMQDYQLYLAHIEKLRKSVKNAIKFFSKQDPVSEIKRKTNHAAPIIFVSCLLAYAGLITWLSIESVRRHDSSTTKYDCTIRGEQTTCYKYHTGPYATSVITLGTVLGIMLILLGFLLCGPIQHCLAKTQESKSQKYMLTKNLHFWRDVQLLLNQYAEIDRHIDLYAVKENDVDKVNFTPLPEIKEIRRLKNVSDMRKEQITTRRALIELKSLKTQLDSLKRSEKQLLFYIDKAKVSSEKAAPKQHKPI